MPKDPVRLNQATKALFGRPPKNMTEEEKEKFEKEKQEALAKLPKHLRMGMPQPGKKGGRKTRKVKKGKGKSTRRH